MWIPLFILFEKCHTPLVSIIVPSDIYGCLLFLTLEHCSTRYHHAPHTGYLQGQSHQFVNLNTTVLTAWPYGCRDIVIRCLSVSQIQNSILSYTIFLQLKHSSDIFKASCFDILTNIKKTFDIFS